MPVTTAIEEAAEQVRDDRAAVAGHVFSYADSDLLCYRADAPPELRDHQQAVWQPLLDWAAETFGAALRVTEGIIPVDLGRSRQDRPYPQGIRGLRRQSRSGDAAPP